MRLDTFSRPMVLVVATTVLIGVFFVLREHWGHALGLAPYLLLLACPLMHLFHHGGHGHKQGSPTHKASGRPECASPPPSVSEPPRS